MPVQTPTRTSEELRSHLTGSPSTLLFQMNRIHEEYRRRSLGMPPHPADITEHKTLPTIANDLIVLARAYADMLDAEYPMKDSK